MLENNVSGGMDGLSDETTHIHGDRGGLSFAHDPPNAGAAGTGASIVVSDTVEYYSCCHLLYYGQKNIR